VCFFLWTFLAALVRPMATIKVRPTIQTVRSARSTGAIYAKFDTTPLQHKLQQLFVKPEVQEEESESDAEHCFESWASDYEEGAEESAGADSASDCTGPALGDPEDRIEDDGDAYDCEYYELRSIKPLASVLKNRNGYQRPHIPCPLLVEEEYVKE
jgi:hypothetical protein